MRPARLAALGGYFGLLGAWLAWAALPAATRHAPSALALGLAALPLLLFLPALWRDWRGGYTGLGLLSLFYFMHGVGTATAPGDRPLALLEVAFSLCLFGGSLARLRARG